MFAGRWLILALAICAIGFVVSGCSAGGSLRDYSDLETPATPIDEGGDDGSGTSDIQAPVVASTFPADGATDFALNSSVEFQFSEPMDPSSINTDTFSIYPGTISGDIVNSIAEYALGSQAVESIVSYVDATMIARSTPIQELDPGTNYIAILFRTVKDLSGNEMGEDRIITFTTSDAEEDGDDGDGGGGGVAPSVSEVSPADGSAGVDCDSSIDVTFDMEMDESSITSSSFQVSSDFLGGDVDGSISYDAGSHTATFTPSTSLIGVDDVSVALTTDILGADGTPIASSYNFSFSTGHAPASQVAHFETLGVVLKADGTVWTWGDNRYGQLGVGLWEADLDDSRYPMRVPGIIDAVSVAAGYYHGLALKSDGTVWAWGYGEDGELGDGNWSNSNAPVQVTALTGVEEIAAGWAHSMALKADGTVWVWGAGWYGQLGNAGWSNSSVPVQALGLTNVEEIVAGSEHSMALKDDGTVWAWGYGGDGNLGVGSWNDSNVALQVHQSTGMTYAASIGSGMYHSLVIDGDGDLWAWGNNYDGQCGYDTWDWLTEPAPVAMGTMGPVKKVSGGGDHTIALTYDGEVWAWGYGKLGDGSEFYLAPTVAIGSLPVILDIATGWSLSIAIDGDGEVWTWGNGWLGRLEATSVYPTLVVWGDAYGVVE